VLTNGSVGRWVDPEPRLLGFNGLVDCLEQLELDRVEVNRIAKAR
jgi:hypothetical protein